MIEEARANLRERGPGFTFEVLDAQELAYESDSFDAVIANHMLYHLDSRDKAFAAVRSVLNEGGALYVTTNGADYLRQLMALCQKVKPTTSWSSVGDRFSLDNGGPQLNMWFERVEVRRFDGELRVTDVQPLIDYFQSSDRMRLDDDQQRRFSTFAEHQILVNGAFRITTAAGMIVATKGTTE